MTLSFCQLPPLVICTMPGYPRMTHVSLTGFTLTCSRKKSHQDCSCQGDSSCRGQSCTCMREQSVCCAAGGQGVRYQSTPALGDLPHTALLPVLLASLLVGIHPLLTVINPMSGTPSEPLHPRVSGAGQKLIQACRLCSRKVFTIGTLPLEVQSCWPLGRTVSTEEGQEVYGIICLQVVSDSEDCMAAAIWRRAG